MLKSQAMVVVVAALMSLPVEAQTPGTPASVAKTTRPPATTTNLTSTATRAATKQPSATTKKAIPPRTAGAKQPSANPKTRLKTKVGSKPAKGKKVPEPQPVAQLPPPPPTPAQLPPNPARVSMRNGLLTIEANNSTLADVLTGVRRETKAAIDLPAGASGERVVASLGPGTPQNVLTSLLNGSRFDYIILGSQDQPDAVQRVILRAKSGPETVPGGPALTAQRVPNQAGAQQAQPDESDEGTPAEEVPDENNPQSQQQEIDNEQQEQQQQQQQQQPQQGQQQPGVKTPEQLLEELRQMQQQQQQQQNQSGQPQPYQQQQPQQPQDEQ